MDAAIERAKQYVLQAQMPFFQKRLRRKRNFRFSKELNCPLLANMTEFGRTPYFTAQQFESWGFRMVIYPVTSLRVAAKAMAQVFEEIQLTGTQKESLSQMQTRSELYETIRYFEYEALDGKIAKTILPEKG